MVVLGKYTEYLDTYNEEHESNVSEIIVHPDYDHDTTDNDIAIMVLANPPPVDSNNQAINSLCLDTGNTLASFNSTSVCYIVGFGHTTGKIVLQQLEIQYTHYKFTINSGVILLS